MALSVGDGATVTVYSDRKACTVERITASGKTMWVREDTAVLLNGADSDEEDKLVFVPGGFAAHCFGTQRYSYAPNPAGKLWKATLRTLRNGKQVWKISGHPSRSPGMTVRPGRHQHYDYNF